MVHITQSPVHARIWLRDQRPGPFAKDMSYRRMPSAC